MAIKPFQYYSDPTLIGNYQFSTLNEVIDGLLLERFDEDSYLRNVNRSMLIYQAKMGIKELTKSTSSNVLAIKMTVGDKGYIEMPQD